MNRSQDHIQCNSANNLGTRKKSNQEWISAGSWNLVDVRMVLKNKIDSSISERLKEKLREQYRNKDKNVEKSMKK